MTDLRTPESAAGEEVIGEDELVAADDSIIGRAFLWSLLVFIVVGVAIAGMVWVMNRPVKVVVQQAREFVPPKVVETSVQPPLVTFSDQTTEAGIDFVHVNGATGEKLLPETMGGGCAFFDFDNDGDQDLLLVNSTTWEHFHNEIRDRENNGSDVVAAPTHALYRNDGNGTFTDVTAESGLDESLYGMGCAVGDYDNDGRVDVYIAAVGANRLYRNLGEGLFEQRAHLAGIEGDPNEWSTSAGFIDYDNDGLLDLFVCNYIKWSRNIDIAVNYSLVGIGRAYGPPNNFEGAHNYLYRNRGDGTFEDVSERAGIQVNSIQNQPMGKALGVAFEDIDADGWMDIIVANDTIQNFLFHNDRDGTFTEIGAQSGVAFDRNGASTGAMGLDVAAYRNDRSLGIAIGNFANEMSSLYVAAPDSLQFTDEAITEGIGSPTRASLTFGVFFFDYDLDGRLDLVHANGHIEDEINIVQPSQQYQQPAQLFWNAGPDASACFVQVPADVLGDLAMPMVGRGAAYADIDGDGDLDILLTQVNGRPLLLRNDQATGHHWLRIKLIGDGKRVNRDGIGSLIELTSGGVMQRQRVMPTRSYLSQMEMPVTFGLGTTGNVDSLTVTWTDGTKQTVECGEVDRLITAQYQAQP